MILAEATGSPMSNGYQMCTVLVIPSLYMQKANLAHFWQY